MTPIRRAVAAVVLIGAVGCLTQAKAMSSWVGATDATLVSQWGAPTRSITLSDSSRVMTWSTSQLVLWPRAHEEVCERNFTVSRLGLVTGWSTTGC